MESSAKQPQLKDSEDKSVGSLLLGHQECNHAVNHRAIFHIFEAKGFLEADITLLL